MTSSFEFGRPRSASEAAVFMRSFDYMTPYKECNGKNGLDLALDLLGAQEAPFGVDGSLLVPLTVGKALDNPRMPERLATVTNRATHVGKNKSKSSSIATATTEGVLELLALGATKHAAESPRVGPSVISEDNVPRIISELIEDKAVPLHIAAQASTDLAKILHKSAAPSHKTERPMLMTTNKHGRTIIQHATLAQVAKAFASESQDMTAIQHLILAHEHFVTSKELFSHFTELFLLHQSSSGPDQIIQARILNVIKKWIEISLPAMKSSGTFKLLQKFQSNINTSNPKLTAVLEKALMQADRQSTALDLEGITGPSSLKPLKSKLKQGEHWELVDFEPLEIARQLTLIDFELAKKVNPGEFLKARWVEDKAPTLQAASKRVNDLTYWFAYQVVSTESMKKRVKVMVHIVKIAKHLLVLNSFNSFMAFYLAFNLASTARLTQTWKNVPAKYFQMWKKFSKIMTPLNNFKAYREHLETVRPPMILCQEVLLKDLLYQEEGRPDFVDPGVIDMNKMDEIGRLIDSFRVCQNQPYSLQKSATLLSYLREIPSWDSAEAAAKTLDSLSYAIEPSSIQFPTTNFGDPINRVKSLGAIPSMFGVRDAEFGENRLQFSHPKPSPRNPILEDSESSSPTSQLAVSPRGQYSAHTQSTTSPMDSPVSTTPMHIAIHTVSSSAPSTSMNTPTSASSSPASAHTKSPGKKKRKEDRTSIVVQSPKAEY